MSFDSGLTYRERVTTKWDERPTHELRRVGPFPPRMLPRQPGEFREYRYTQAMLDAIERALNYSWTRMPSGPT